MRKLIVVAALVLCGTAQAQQSMNWNNSPLNYDNSTMNYDNSSMNYKNSPLNYDNSRMNYNDPNGTFDSNGNRTGYEVKSPSGTVNRFDNDGNRTGYRRER